MHEEVGDTGGRPARWVRLVRGGIAAHGLECARLTLRRASLVLVAALAALASLVAALLLLFRAVDPPASALMLGHLLSGSRVDQRWVPLERISPNLVRAVIVAEDGQFCRHRGIDFRELDAALKQAEHDGLARVRGASTITMQVAKNMFLWPSKEFLRKGLELGIALMIDAMWTKRRILEVYLNIAQWGPGVFGAEAAARHHFRKPAARLGEREAALLAASLPNPVRRVAGAAGPGLRRLAQVIEMRARSVGQRAACVLAKARR